MSKKKRILHEEIETCGHCIYSYEVKGFSNNPLIVFQTYCAKMNNDIPIREAGPSGIYYKDEIPDWCPFPIKKEIKSE